MSEYIPCPDTKDDARFAENVAYEMQPSMDRALRMEQFASQLEQAPHEMHHSYSVDATDLKRAAHEYKELYKHTDFPGFWDFSDLSQKRTARIVENGIVHDVIDEPYYLGQLKRSGTISINSSSPLKESDLKEMIYDDEFESNFLYGVDSTISFHCSLMEQRMSDPVQRLQTLIASPEQPIQVSNAEMASELRNIAANYRNQANKIGEHVVADCVGFRELKAQEAQHITVRADFGLKALTWSPKIRYSNEDYAEEYTNELEQLTVKKELCVKIAKILKLDESMLEPSQRAELVDAADDYLAAVTAKWETDNGF